jgi:predicted DNA-binding transcriptional regulator AlpA
MGTSKRLDCRGRREWLYEILRLSRQLCGAVPGDAVESIPKNVGPEDSTQGSGANHPSAVKKATAIPEEKGEGEVSQEWAVTMSFKGSPPASSLIAIEEMLEASDGMVGAQPARGLFTVTTTVAADDWEKASGVGVDGILHVVRLSGVDSTVVGVETLDRDEYDRRAEEPSIPELISAPEVAELLGVTRQRVHQLAADNQLFPEPFMRLGSGPLWIADAIQRFDHEWSRKPGRPRNVA